MAKRSTALKFYPGKVDWDIRGLCSRTELSGLTYTLHASLAWPPACTRLEDSVEQHWPSVAFLHKQFQRIE